ncbi:MAG: YbaB/EbfC family nucleoid-associated protein [Anaerolineae bacterium]|jgi:hypothetical protein
MPRGRGGLPGGKNMMRQLQEMQERMLAEQEALAQETVQVSMGGGAVKVVMTGHQKVESIEIQPELLDPEESEMLIDLLIAAVNEAVDRSQQMAQDRMGALTQGLGLPPGLGL